MSAVIEMLKVLLFINFFFFFYRAVNVSRNDRVQKRAWSAEQRSSSKAVRRDKVRIMGVLAMQGWIQSENKELFVIPSFNDGC